MKKEIKFRGMSLNGWVYGNYVMLVDKLGDAVDCIWELGASRGTPVEYETIGQFTGVKDNNGTEIYEGDILSTDLSRPYLVVEFRNGAFMYQCHDSGSDYYDFMTSANGDSNFTKYHEVIGNIHEDSHLLEE